MKKFLAITLAASMCMVTCTEKQPEQPSGISEEIVNGIIEDLTPKPINYEGKDVRVVISPDRKHVYVLESQKEWVAKEMNAKLLDAFRWEIRINEEEPSIAFVTMVKSVKEFTLAFPAIQANIALGIKGLCKQGDACTQTNTLETAPCEKYKGGYIKNVYYSHFCECDTRVEGLCFQITARVGTRYFYNDQINCSGDPSSIRGEIWKETCLYDKRPAL